MNTIGRDYLAFSFLMDRLKAEYAIETENSNKTNLVQKCFCSWCEGMMTDYGESE